MQLGGAICGAFVLFGALSVLLYKPWRRRIDRRRAHLVPVEEPLGANDDIMVSDPAREDVNTGMIFPEIGAAEVESVETYDGK